MYFKMTGIIKIGVQNQKLPKNVFKKALYDLLYKTSFHEAIKFSIGVNWEMSVKSVSISSV